jgi:hypothetical protein
MIRCRDCRGLLVEMDSEFTLASNVAVSTQPTCSHCGTAVDTLGDDCPRCAAELLDDLLKGPAESSAATTSIESKSGIRQRSDSAHPGSRPANSRVPSNSNQADDRLRPESHDGEQRTAVATARRRKRRDIVAASSDTAQGNAVDTSAARLALLALLTDADATLRAEIAVALGKLGDKAAVAPLERHMADPDVNVRRAVAAALVQLGHPKGEQLIEIAERKPAASVLTEAKSTTAAKPKRSEGGLRLTRGLLTKVGAAIVMIAVAAGGTWYAMNNSAAPARRTRKAKSVTAKKLAALPSRAALVLNFT